MFTFLQRLVLFPRHLIRASPGAGDDIAGLERLWLDIGRERYVEAWFLPGDGVSEAAPGPLVVFAHGNGELIDHWAHELALYREMGVSVLLPEYRGYGRSDGRPGQRALTGDMVAWYDHVAARPDVDASRIVLHGRSLGGGIVCALASERPPAAMILESTFTSITDVVRAWHVPAMLVRDRFDNRSCIERFDKPLLVVHGTCDELLPVAHGRALADAAARARLVLYECGHNDLMRLRDGYWGEIERWLRDSAILAR